MIVWICLNNAFFSIVTDYFNENNLLVRARDAESIPNVFGNVKVEKTSGRDYLYRTSLPREKVAEVISANLANINYSNFKASVKNKKLARAYGGMWEEMFNYQEELEYGPIK